MCNVKNQLKAIYLSMHNNACLGTCLFSAGTYHGNLLKSLLTMSFIPQAHSGKCASQTRLKGRERIWKKMKLNAPGR